MKQDLVRTFMGLNAYEQLCNNSLILDSSTSSGTTEQNIVNIFKNNMVYISISIKKNLIRKTHLLIKKSQATGILVSMTAASTLHLHA